MKKHLELDVVAHAVILEFQRLRQHDHNHECESSLGYIVRQCLKKRKTSRRQQGTTKSFGTLE
jgi:hypothetical protein